MYDRGSVLDRHGSDDTRQRGHRRRFYSWSPYTRNQRNYRSARKPRHGNPRQGNPPAQSRGDKKPPRLGEGVSRFGRLLSNHLASITAWRAGGTSRRRLAEAEPCRLAHHPKTITLRLPPPTKPQKICIEREKCLAYIPKDPSFRSLQFHLGIDIKE